MVRALRVALIDFFTLSASWFLAYYIRQALTPLFGYPINEISPYLKAYPVIIISWILVSMSFGLYSRKSRGKSLENAIRAWAIGSLISMTIAYLLREFMLGRSVLLIFSATSFVLLTINHYIFERSERRKVVILGDEPLAFRILQKLEDSPDEWEFLGFLSQRPEDVGKNLDGHPVVGTVDDFLQDKIEIKTEKGVQKPDILIIASRQLSIDDVMEIVTSREDANFLVATEGFEALARGFPVEFVGGIPLVEIGFESPSPVYNAVKRIFDLTVASFGLLLSLPLFLVIAIAIKLDSPGPVFFVQERVGYKGKKFKLIKFRTMYVDAPKYAKAPRSARDPRITRVGAFLRRTSLDELPQLINVIKGDMSLVGPRPEMPFIVEKYKRWQRKRLDVKPGITGLWQILGRKDLPLEENIHYDLVYIKNRSFLFDLVILLKTVPVVLARRGAY